MLKSGKVKKINLRSLRLGIAAFVLGVGLGYSITDDRTPAEHIVALGERVKTVLFVKTEDAGKDG